MEIDGGRGVRDAARQWLRQSDDRWVLDFFDYLNLIGFTKAVVAGGGVLNGVIAVLSLLGPDGVLWPGVGTTAMIAVVVLCFVWTVRWLLLHWPTRTESLMLCAIADVVIAVTIFAHQNLLLGIASASLFVATSIYMTLFHDAVANLCHIIFTAVVVVAAVVTCCIVQGMQWLPIATAEATVVVMAVVVALPILHIGFSIVRRSAVDSLTDSLTGLLNRRGFYRAVAAASSRGATTTAPHRHSRWIAAVVDLDNFKVVNDIDGHVHGDRILVDVAAAVRLAAESHTIITRFGGDEFVLATQYDSELPDADRCAAIGERLVGAVVEASGGAVTASVGIAGGENDDDGRITTVIADADRAMYAAKIHGGNRFELG
ncbi:MULTISPECIES: GGDEF domain-containing protein [unclassified Gordonia (in: high G+C Gram-positive bacteria)]|uniref:GGDEF domain-containing protein n=1 Tax=unclassified Gordonia (in: high G+C Gram-positive bacteria) TaxID=2657482 RepID=UPI0007E95AB5|nr:MULTISPECIES: GGDEF domain-containing protein [unclassified Gordonia (in: high G+C Gram-positive bacteria)]OBA30890.1 hypothetical protein A5766_14680 [Gordonia sp. 852002-51296_SCH5728562-b]OBA60832.1 hypothetical protein A5777_04090 [Gordonia sp. 852002-10350_SCH5691597]